MLKITIMSKDKKIILITGASSGIGRETALQLAKKGHKVFAGIRRKIDKIELESLHKNITGVYLDVTNQGGIDKAFWFVIKHTDKIDVLINNAGIVVAGPIEFIPIKNIKEQFDTNTFGALAVTQKFLPFLKNGKIINVSSMAASGLFPYISPYCASKRAMDILFNSLMLENKDNIKVISVKPAAIKTPIWNKSVKRTKNQFENLSEVAKQKYNKELTFLEQNALENNTKGIEIKEVTDTILKIIETKNPKPSYNVGKKASLVEFLSKLPLSLTNKVIKNKLKKI